MMVDQIRKTLQIPRRWLGVAAVVLALSACVGYDRDENKRTTGEITDDTFIQAKLKSHLVDDQQLRGWKIDTDVHRGVVTLRGTVRSEEERRRALEIARSVAGVKDVRDELQIAN